MIIRIGTMALVLATSVALSVGCTKKKRKKTPANHDAKIEAMRPAPSKDKLDRTGPRKRVSPPARHATSAGGATSGLVGKKVTVNLHHSAWKYHNPQYIGNVISVDQTGLLLRLTEYYNKRTSENKKSDRTMYMPWSAVRHVFLAKK